MNEEPSDGADLSRAREERVRKLLTELEAETKRRRVAEDAAAAAQAQLALTLASIDTGYIVTDAQGKVALINKVSERLTGWSVADVEGKPLAEVFRLEDRAAASDHAHHPIVALLNQRALTETTQLVTIVARDGTRTPVQAHVTLGRLADGSPRGLTVVLRDRTHQMQAEVDASRLAAIIESSQDAIISKRLDGTLLTWNAAAEQMFGWRAGEAIGQSVRMLIPEDRQGEEMRIIADLARGVTVRPFDTQRVHKLGHLLDVSLTISPVRDADGRIVGASKIVRDVSDRRRAERLESENRRIQEAARVKGQFLASVSHELRTPLNAIIGFAELLQSGLVDENAEKRRRFIGHIAASGHHLLQLINDVLDLAKVESGRFEFHPEAIDLTRLVREVYDIARGGADRGGIAIGSEIDPSLTGIVLDPVRLKQVLYNYLSNAIKFTPKGGRVVVRAFAVGPAHFRLEVEDSGIGIAPGDMGKLFQEFQQLDTGYAKKHEGTGLGLALTRRLVEAQGGSVGVASVPGEGSVFHAVLNRVHGTDPVRVAAIDPAQRPAAEQGHLLVVGHDREVRARIMNGLAGAGFQVSAAATGEQAAQLARQASFDALTLDLHLPDFAGLDLLAKLRDESPGLPGPVIGLTAPGDGGAASFAIADILGKPIRSDEVAAAMQRLQNGRQTPGCVMVIDDDPLALDLMRTTLAGLGAKAVCFENGRVALAQFDSVLPEAIFLDLVMPEFDGFAVLDALAEMPQARDTPVYIWTSLILTEAEYAQLARTAHAILSKGGGRLVEMLERIRRWRPPRVIRTEA